MKRFTQLFASLDETTRSSEKLAALVNYFSSAPAEDAAWALYFLTGNKIKRLVTTTKLRAWMAEHSQLPLWLVEESYDTVGDLAETLALLAASPQPAWDIPLSEFVERRLLPLRNQEEAIQKASLCDLWSKLSADQCFVFHKLITGQFRVGVAHISIAKALAQVAGLPTETMAHRLMGTWQPTADFFRSLLKPEEGPNITRPYPFFLAHPLSTPLEDLGSPADWQAEWKWDGIRSQLIKRNGEWLLWSRGEELITDRFPDLSSLADALPSGTVLDGEVLAYENGLPLPFALLQKRISRKRLTPKILTEIPVVFMAYDILEADGSDLRSLPTSDRRTQLQALALNLSNIPQFQLSPLVLFSQWPELHAQYLTSRERLVEGLMLKSASAPYGVGRTTGAWWKWKSQPYSIDAVMIYAQRGHGRRANLFSDYTFAVWHEGQLVPMAKAYSGLTDEEMQEVDAFVKQNTIERFGPIHSVKAELVFELHFEGIQHSTRHKSGIAVRFPRIARRRPDKQAQDADTLQTLRALLSAHSPQEVKP